MLLTFDLNESGVKLSRLDGYINSKGKPQSDKISSLYVKPIF